MATGKQIIGRKGENLVSKNCICPKCKKGTSLKVLPNNFKCADVICDFCGFLGQVKTISTNNIDKLPKNILGAAWSPQKDRMNAGIYFPLFIVLLSNKKNSIFYLSADLQTKEMFIQRKPLSKNAKRAGWQGFVYDLEKLPKGSIVRIK